MPAISSQFHAILDTLRFWDIIDILIVAYTVYYVYSMIKGTKAATLLKGLGVLIAFTLFSKWLNFHVINWLLQKSITVVLVALPVVFQPELRKALERIGRGKLFRKDDFDDVEDLEKVLSDLVAAIVIMARQKVGALIVLEQETGLTEYMETGVALDARLSQELIMTIFSHNTPLHDGAVIIRSARIMSASCLLPLTDDRNLSKELGTRHRAAIGLSDVTDALVIVVSEETGTISLAHEGKIQRYLTANQLKELLHPVICESKLSWQEILKEAFRRK